MTCLQFFLFLEAYLILQLTLCFSQLLFLRNQFECGKIWSSNNSVSGHFSRSVCLLTLRSVFFFTQHFQRVINHSCRVNKCKWFYIMINMNVWKRKTYLILEILLIFTTDSYKSVKLFESSKVNINANKVLFLKKSTPLLLKKYVFTLCLAFSNRCRCSNK